MQMWQCCWLKPWEVVLGTLAWGQAAFSAHCDICPSRGDGGVQKGLESRQHISCGKVRGKFLRAGSTGVSQSTSFSHMQLGSATTGAGYGYGFSRKSAEPTETLTPSLNAMHTQMQVQVLVWRSWWACNGECGDWHLAGSPKGGTSNGLRPSPLSFLQSAYSWSQMRVITSLSMGTTGELSRAG